MYLTVALSIQDDGNYYNKMEFKKKCLSQNELKF